MAQKAPERLPRKPSDLGIPTATWCLHKLEEKRIRRWEAKRYKHYLLVETGPATKRRKKTYYDCGTPARATGAAKRWSKEKLDDGWFPIGIHGARDWLGADWCIFLCDPKEPRFLKKDPSRVYESLDEEFWDAVYRNDLKAVKALLKKSVDLNYTKDRKRLATPLGCAIARGYHEIAHILIAAGASFEPNETPEDDRLEELSDRLFNAIEASDLRGVRSALRDGAPPINWLRRMKCPLCAAAQFGHVGIVKALVEGGARTKNSLALFDAASAGHLRVVKYLISIGMNPKDGTGEETPLEMAELNGHRDVVELLKKY